MIIITDPAVDADRLLSILRDLNPSMDDEEICIMYCWEASTKMVQ